MPKQSHTDQRRRTLSQNLLTERGVKQFIRVVPVEPAVPMVEIGGGRGALTTALANFGSELTVYELDSEFARLLRTQFPAPAGIKIIEGDFLQSESQKAPYRVVANVPFSISMQVVRRLVDDLNCVHATLLLQLELAKKHTGEFGRWTQFTVASWPTHELCFLGKVHRSSFRPTPRVDGGIIEIRRRETPLLQPSEIKQFRRDVALGFSGVGGSVAASLVRRYPRKAVENAITRVALDRRTVVGYVTPTQWMGLHAHLHASPAPERTRNR